MGKSKIFGLWGILAKIWPPKLRPKLYGEPPPMTDSSSNRGNLDSKTVFEDSQGNG